LTAGPAQVKNAGKDMEASKGKKGVQGEKKFANATGGRNRRGGSRGESAHKGVYG